MTQTPTLARHAPLKINGSRVIMHLLALTVGAGLLTAFEASAQAVYRVTGADGKVTFTDQLPPSGNLSSAPAATAATAPGPASSPAAAALPFELRQVASRYPVVLYTGADCIACGAGRALLSARGVVFTEKTVTTAEDAQALQRLTGATTLPVISIGSQQIKGFSEAEWSQYLDAAGYPKTSRLPRSYRPASAVPLVTALTAAPASPAAPAPANPPVTAGEIPNSTSPNDNPAGIRF